MAPGQTSVAPVVPRIAHEIGDAAHESWVATAYLLGGTGAIAFVGKLGDLFGRKPVLQAAALVFAVGSVLCALSQTMTMLTISRAVEGIGGGAMSVTGSALVGEVVPLRSRGTYQGILGAVFGVAKVGAMMSPRLSCAPMPSHSSGISVRGSGSRGWLPGGTAPAGRSPCGRSTATPVTWLTLGTR